MDRRQDNAKSVANTNEDWVWLTFQVMQTRCKVGLLYFKTSRRFASARMQIVFSQLQNHPLGSEAST